MCSTTVSDCESVLLSQYAMMLKRHLRRDQKFSSPIKTTEHMNDVKSLQTKYTQTKNKNIHAYCVKEQFSQYV